MDNLKTGLFIKSLRKKNNLTQSELGDIVGVSGKAVSKWERGSTLPNLSSLNILVHKFNVSIEEILDGKIKKRKMISFSFYKENAIILLTVLLLILLVTLIILMLLKSF